MVAGVEVIMARKDAGLERHHLLRPDPKVDGRGGGQAMHCTVHGTVQSVLHSHCTTQYSLYYTLSCTSCPSLLCTPTCTAQISALDTLHLLNQGALLDSRQAKRPVKVC